jgi:DNA-binding response OmpR family regulator
VAGSHIALIVEDEPEMAAEIADLVRSFGHDSIRAETKAEALALIEGGGFCYVLLDMQIKADRDSIKAYASAGMSLLSEIRRRFPHRASTDMHLLPVLVVSGNAKEHDDVVRAFKIGADDFIRKPLSSDGTDLDAKIRHCLEQAGRAHHGLCYTKMLEAENGAVVLAAEGDAFWHLPDYSEVRLRGVLYRFPGDIQQRVIRRLHDAAKTTTPWVSGKVALAAARSTDVAMKMGNLLGDHPCWGTLVMSDTRGKYRLVTE